MQPLRAPLAARRRRQILDDTSRDEKHVYLALFHLTQNHIIVNFILLCSHVCADRGCLTCDCDILSVFNIIPKWLLSKVHGTHAFDARCKLLNSLSPLVFVGLAVPFLIRHLRRGLVVCSYLDATRSEYDLASSGDMDLPEGRKNLHDSPCASSTSETPTQRTALRDV